MAGLAGEGQNFDGNGHVVRFQTGGGTKTLSTGPSNFTATPLFFNPRRRRSGTRPVYPGQAPAVPARRRPATQKTLPDLNGARTGPPARQCRGQGNAAGARTARCADAGRRSRRGADSASPGVGQAPPAPVDPRRREAARARLDVAGDRGDRPAATGNAATGDGRRGNEARDPQALPRLRGDHRAVRRSRAVVGGYILVQPALLPAGLGPGPRQDFFTLNAEFQTAKAVTPGQGQTVTSPASRSARSRRSSSSTAARS